MKSKKDIKKYIKKYIIKSIDSPLNESECIGIHPDYVSTLEKSKCISMIERMLADFTYDEMILGKILSLEKQLQSECLDTLEDIELELENR